MLFWNVDGLTSIKMHTLDLQKSFLCHDIVFLAETWLQPHASVPALPPALSNAFHVKLCSRPWSTNKGRNSGGVVAFVRKNLPFLEESEWTADRENGIMWGTVPRLGLGSVHLVGCYFSPQHPGAIYNTYDLQDPFQVLQHLLSTRVKPSDLVLLFGDFNARMGGLDDDAAPADALLAGFLPCSSPLEVMPLLGHRILDTICNNFGKSLAALASSNDLVAFNGSVPGDNNGFTFHSRQDNGGRSTVDWVLGSTSIVNPAGIGVRLEILPLLPESPHTMLSLEVAISPPLHAWDYSHATVPEWVEEFMHEQPLSTVRSVWNPRVQARCAAFLQADLVPALDLILADTEVGRAGDRFQDLLGQAVRAAQPPPLFRRPASRSCEGLPYFDAECQHMRRDLKRALRDDPGGPLTKTLQRKYTSKVRRCKRLWNQARVNTLTYDLINCPRKFWKTARVRKVARVVGHVDDWLKYVQSLFGTPAPVSTEKHGVVRSSYTPDGASLSFLFTAEEVAAALKALKNSKASDLFGVRAEVVKELLLGDDTNYFLMPHLLHTFKLALSSGTLPKTWCQGCVHPIAKVSCPSSCDDYRCITVGALLGKLFASLLDRRLNDHLEVYNMRIPFQGGFRREYSTMDQAFVLNHIIEAAKHQKSTVYCTFVDFRKAFDTVRHDHLWDRLRYYGIGGPFLQCIQSLYQQSSVCVTVNGELTEFAPIAVGVRQGDPLSPTLFGLYIETLQDYLQQGMDASDTFLVGGLPVHILLYADDLVLIATSPKALQKAHDILATFCLDWNITVNMAKTKVVVFNPGARLVPFPWSLAGQVLDIAEQYTYLGLVFHGRKGIRLAPDKLTDAGRKALFAMTGICSHAAITDPSLRQFMFNALVLPAISYGAELWGGYFPAFNSATYFSKTPAEKVHSIFLRWLTGASRTTHKRVLPQIAGCLPLGAHWVTRTAGFWDRLVCMPPARLSQLAFRDNVALMMQGGQCWAGRAVQQLLAVGVLSGVDIDHPVTPLHDHRLPAAVVREALASCNKRFWEPYIIDPHSLPTAVSVPDRTLYTFASWFLQMSLDRPAMHSTSAQNWRTLSRFCTGGHRLECVNALWHIKPRSACVCPCCGTGLEDEMHFMLQCPVYAMLRAQTPLFHDVSTHANPMQHIFQHKNVKFLAKYLRQSMALRSAILAGSH